MTEVHDNYIELEQQTPPATFEYELLRGHFRTNGSFKNDEQLRSEYVHLTDDLIHLMTDGVIVDNPETGVREKQKPDVVVWLDKSARPVSWLTKELWPTLASDSQGNTPDIPEFRYVNIDREQWVNNIDPNGSGFLDIKQIDQSVIRSLRSIFIDPRYTHDGLTETIDAAPSELDGKTVLIVDEVRASGRTLEIASKFFNRAFPNAKIATTHWMKGIASKEGGATGNADLPVWYKETDVSGRGVGNRDERLSQKSKSRTQRLGSWFLSTKLAIQDSTSRQLRVELHQLSEDVKNGAVLVVPSMERDEEDFIERAERLNKTDFEDFKQLRKDQISR